MAILNNLSLTCLIGLLGLIHRGDAFSRGFLPKPSNTFVPDTPSSSSSSSSSSCRCNQKRRTLQPLHAATNTNTNNNKAEPRTGFAQQLLNLALASPIWTYVMVPQARATMVKTAEENGIPWMAAKEWLRSQKDAPWSEDNDNNNNNNNNKDVVDRHANIEYPEYYKKSFHAYPEGNLSYDAAFEQELASRAVGARNFPTYSDRGEDVFRGAFDRALSELGADILVGTTAHHHREEKEKEEEVLIVDFGCGTGTSTRRLAKRYSDPNIKFVGIDLSPYFVDVGRTLLKLAPSAMSTMSMDDNNNNNGNSQQQQQQQQQQGWITSIDPDPRIELRQGNVASTPIPSDSASVVNLTFVLHELPLRAAKDVVAEAHRILKPNVGQLWICEMDFESPAYAAQRENALLFSLLRATEPYLDEYADGMGELRDYIVGMFDGGVRITAATGRHYSMVARKGGRRVGDDGVEGGADGGKQRALLEDSRFLEDGSYAIEDTHLKPWESKQDD